MASISQETLIRLVDLAGQLTKDTGPVRSETHEQVLDYRLKLFRKAIDQLYRAVMAAGEEPSAG